jgi:hypothetical protein
LQQSPGLSRPDKKSDLLAWHQPRLKLQALRVNSRNLLARETVQSLVSPLSVSANDSQISSKPAVSITHRLLRRADRAILNPIQMKNQVDLWG